MTLASRGNATMQIWLGKNRLEQKDKIETIHSGGDTPIKGGGGWSESYCGRPDRVDRGGDCAAATCSGGGK
jgi:hypothetical protein